MIEPPKWTRKRPSLYRLSPNAAEHWGQVERGGETGSWYWSTRKVKRLVSCGVADRLEDGKAAVEAAIG